MVIIQSDNVAMKTYKRKKWKIQTFAVVDAKKLHVENSRNAYDVVWKFYVSQLLFFIVQNKFSKMWTFHINPKVLVPTFIIFQLWWKSIFVFLNFMKSNRARWCRRVAGLSNRIFFCAILLFYCFTECCFFSFPL